MNIAIDIRRIRDFGPGTYTRNLVNHLARLGAAHKFFLLGAESDRAELDTLPENFTFLELDGGERRWLPWRRLAWLLGRHGVHLCHFPYLTTPWLLPCPYMITVHDLAAFLEPADDGNRLAAAWRFYRVRRSLARARQVLTVSQAARADLARVFALPAAGIEVIYNALDDRLRTTPDADEAARTLARYSVEDPYVLYAGSVRPHKNLSRLIEAFAVVRDELRDHPRYARLKLLIIGDELSQHPELRRAVMQSRVQAETRFLGFVPPKTLSVFYARAAAFVFPSLYEGFGLPPLEAMAHGAPVVASSVTALPEVLGEAAVFVNPENVFDITRGIRQALLDDETRAKLAALGRQQVARFSWEASARRLLEVYEAAGPPRAVAVPPPSALP